MNNAVLVGRLTKDPELRTTQSGISVASFTIAVQRNYKTDGEYQADFINCVAWRQTAEFVSRYFGKGKPIALAGNIQTRTYDDKQGQRRYVTEVIANQVSFVPGDNSGGEAKTQGQPDADALFADMEPIGETGELPF